MHPHALRSAALRGVRMPKRVLFVCVGNSCRSQMAEGFARAYADGRAESASAGTAPAASVAPFAVQVMREKGVDISRQRPKPLDLDIARRADVVVTLCAEADEACPATLLPRIVSWDIEDPIGKPVEKYREVRDVIEARVRAMLRGFGAPVPHVRARHVPREAEDPVAEAAERGLDKAEDDD